MAAPISPNSASVLEAVAASAAAGSVSPLIGLQPGAVIAARVLALLENGQVQLAIGNALVAATTQVPLPLGATVRLAVQSTASGTTLQLVGQVTPQAATPQAVTPQALTAQTVAAEGMQIAATVSPVGGTMVVSGSPAGVVGSGAAAPAVAGALTTPIAAANVASEATPSTPLVTEADLPVAVASQLPAPGIDATVALQAAVRTAAATQNGLSPLYAEIAAAVDLPALPEPVQREASRLLSLRPSFDSDLTAKDVKQAFANSGLFLEARIAEDMHSTPQQPTNAEAGSAPTSASTATIATTSAMANALSTDDLKAALIVFRQVLATALAQSEDGGTITASPAIAEMAAPPSASAQMLAPTELATRPTPPGPSASTTPAPAPRAAQVPPPPFRDGPITAQSPSSATIGATTPPHVAVQTLMAATDGALARQTLLQAASLPGLPSNHLDSSGPRWNFEVPFAIPQGAHVVTNVAQFEISRDGKAATPPEGGGVVWRARFSVDIDPIGRVHAQIGLRGVRTTVTLWAESQEGATRLRAGAAKLTDALRAAELDPGDLVVRDGAPRARAVAAGHFWDRAS